MRNFNLYIKVEEITVSQRRDNFILSTLKQLQNSMLKQRWFWVDTKRNFVLLYQQTQHVESMSKSRRHINIDEFPRPFDMLFWCNFDGRIIDGRHFNVHFRYNSDGRKIDATSTCFLWCIFKEQKIVVVLVSFLEFLIF